jgi:hypothetical protein
VLLGTFVSLALGGSVRTFFAPQLLGRYMLRGIPLPVVRPSPRCRKRRAAAVARNATHPCGNALTHPERLHSVLRLWDGGRLCRDSWRRPCEARGRSCGARGRP